MTSYLLDTNACVYFLNNTHPRLTRRILEVGPSALAVSTLTVAELRFGAARSSRPKANLARVADFLDELAVEPFTIECAALFGQLKDELLKAGTPIADFDIAIGASALALGRVLVTSDRDFRHLHRVTVEDWA